MGASHQPDSGFIAVFSPEEARGLRIGVVTSRFNSAITDRLHRDAIDELLRLGVRREDIVERFVPGAFELPLGAQSMIVANRVDAVICLGCVIRGETPHFEYISQACAYGIQRVALSHGTPVIFGALTTDTVAQATARADGSHSAKGREAARSAIEMAVALRQDGMSRLSEAHA